MPRNRIIAILFVQSVENRLVWAGKVLRAVMLLRTPTLIRDRKFHLIVYKRCMIGSEMVDWLIIQSNKAVVSRTQAVGMWQALLEEGVLIHGSRFCSLLEVR